MKPIYLPIFLFLLLSSNSASGQESTEEKDKILYLTLENGTHPFIIHRIYSDKVLVNKEGGFRFTFSRSEIRAASNSKVTRALVESDRILEQFDPGNPKAMADLDPRLGETVQLMEGLAHVYGWLIPESSRTLEKLREARSLARTTLDLVTRANVAFKEIRGLQPARQIVPATWEEPFRKARELLEQIPDPTLREREVTRVERNLQAYRDSFAVRTRNAKEQASLSMYEARGAVDDGSITQVRWAQILRRLNQTAWTAPPGTERDELLAEIENFRQELAPRVETLEEERPFHAVRYRIAGLKETAETDPPPTWEEIEREFQEIEKDLAALPEREDRSALKTEFENLRAMLELKRERFVVPVPEEVASSSAEIAESTAPVTETTTVAAVAPPPPVPIPAPPQPVAVPRPAPIPPAPVPAPESPWMAFLTPTNLGGAAGALVLVAILFLRKKKDAAPKKKKEKKEKKKKTKKKAEKKTEEESRTPETPEVSELTKAPIPEPTPIPEVQESSPEIETPAPAPATSRPEPVPNADPPPDPFAEFPASDLAPAPSPEPEPETSDELLEPLPISDMAPAPSPDLEQEPVLDPSLDDEESFLKEWDETVRLIEEEQLEGGETPEGDGESSEGRGSPPTDPPLDPDNPF